MPASAAVRFVKIAKPVVFLASLWPAAWVVWITWAAFKGMPGIGANPVADIRNTTGDWALRFLLITLCITPIRKLTGWNDAIRFRRMFGLFAFFYAMVHFWYYVWLDKFFDVQEMTKDIAKRPWITAGFVALVLMVPLAITSTKKWIGRLGGKRWQLLHRLIYFSAAAGVLHFFWLVKLDTSRPVRYGAGLAVLLAIRVWYAIKPRGAASKNEAPAT